MTNKDISPTEHFIFFSKEELDQGYHYCDEIYQSVTNRFPGHKFIGLPDTILIKELSKEEIKEIIEILESYLNE